MTTIRTSGHNLTNSLGATARNHNSASGNPLHLRTFRSGSENPRVEFRRRNTCDLHGSRTERRIQFERHKDGNPLQSIFSTVRCSPNRSTLRYFTRFRLGSKPWNLHRKAVFGSIPPSRSALPKSRVIRHPTNGHSKAVRLPRRLIRPSGHLDFGQQKRARISCRLTRADDGMTTTVEQTFLLSETIQCCTPFPRGL